MARKLKRQTSPKRKFLSCALTSRGPCFRGLERQNPVHLACAGRESMFDGSIMLSRPAQPPAGFLPTKAAKAWRPTRFDESGAMLSRPRAIESGASRLRKPRKHVRRLDHAFAACAAASRVSA